MIAHSSDEYRASVARALAGVDDKLVFNGTIDHARVVIEEAFKSAKDRVRILSNRLDPECYGGQGVIASALVFIGRPDTHLDILVEDPAALRTSNGFLSAVQSIGGTRVRVRTVPEEYVKGYSFNFLTVDDIAFRFEDDRSKPIGVVAGGANVRKVVNHLLTTFDSLFAASQPAELILTPA